MTNARKLAHYHQRRAPAVREGVRLSTDGRRMPVFLNAGSGSGKSRLLGRLLAWQDLKSAIPLVILDPHGVTIDNFLDKLSRMPREVPASVRQYLWGRIRYVDMSGSHGYVFPFPLYYRLGYESLYTISQRYVDVIRKLDPYLQTASVEGYNAFKRTATNVGILLAALDCQITEATDMLLFPDSWLGRVQRQMDSMDNQTAGAFRFLNTFAGLRSENARDRQRASFLNKVDQFELDPVLRAMFGAPRPGIDWRQVEEEKLTVLLDFRRVNDPEQRQFLMMWAYQYFMEYIRFRGPGRHEPISFIVDELAALFPTSELVSDQFAADLDEMINQVARNYSLYLTLATQELYQFSERLQKTLMSMTLIQGRTSDPESAAALTARLDRYHPYAVKKYENVWGGTPLGPIVVERRPVEFTVEEQFILQSYKYQDLRRFEFLVKMPRGEGDISGPARRVSIAELDPGHFPDEGLVAEARALLSERDGWSVDELNRSIQARQASHTLEDETHDDHGALPRSGQLNGD
jgi:hypothetical protein